MPSDDLRTVPPSERTSMHLKDEWVIFLLGVTSFVAERRVGGTVLRQ